MFNLSALAIKIKESKRLVLIKQTSHTPPASTISLSIVKHAEKIQVICCGDIIYDGDNEVEALNLYHKWYVKSDYWAPEDPIDSGLFI